MNKHIILNMTEKRSDFKGLYEIIKIGENIYSAIIKNKPKAVKKFVQSISDEIVIVSKNCEDKKLLNNKLLSSGDITFDNILPLLGKVIKQTIEKYNYNLPLKEIYISSSPQIAYSLIKEIYEMSRLFTVINSSAKNNVLFDELYFKYGVIVRQREKFILDSIEDTALIRYDYTPVSKFYRSPVIDVLNSYGEGENIISLNNVSVIDKQLEHIKNLWGGVTGLGMYSLLGITPQQDAQVNIIKKADKIFRLDITGF